MTTEQFDELKALLNQILAAVKPVSKPATVTALPAVDLDSEYGNPEVRFNPKRWQGEDYRNRRYADCSPEFLDTLAEALEYGATQDEAKGAVDSKGNPRAKWGRLDAARARGWAQRKRDGWQSAVPGDDEIPF